MLAFYYDAAAWMSWEGWAPYVHALREPCLLFHAHPILQEFVRLAQDMVAGKPSPPSKVTPPDLEPHQISLLPPVVLDAVPPGSHFGEVVTDVEGGRQYKPGDTVTATFRCVLEHPCRTSQDVCRAGPYGPPQCPTCAPCPTP